MYKRQQYNLQYLYYNKDIFEAAGLDPETPPTTLDELKADAIACTDPSKNQYGIGFPQNYTYYCEYLWANGGDVISTDGKENLLNSQENIDTLTWLQDMVVNEGVSPEGLTGADADTLFQAGQLAMYMSGPWTVSYTHLHVPHHQSKNPTSHSVTSSCPAPAVAAGSPFCSTPFFVPLHESYFCFSKADIRNPSLQLC